MASLELPAAPAHLVGAVKAWSQAVTIPTYEPLPADRNPMFLEKRVYQGSSGKVYPLPCVDRISTTKTPRVWQAIHIENEYLRVMILPELGGRIHMIRDKSNGYDAIYNQHVIKPALVGLAGPWVSGGIEFNWPQHHRPSTYMPVDCQIEQHADGSVTVWCNEHEPMQRMKGMHGVSLHPGRSIVELKVRLYNRTSLPQTFLWWANVATKVHEKYQSFFPPDVTCVADHARRATSAFPLCDGKYYGVDYGARAKEGVPPEEQPTQFPPGDYPPNDLRFYANIPVPTSYMCLGSKQDFFGGYDHKAQAGLIAIADHRIAPGKKQWTWGNHEFGYSWDRNLTDPDEQGVYHPYIELMAGVFTDNQPDFSFLMPGEMRTFSQYWYPIQKIGPAVEANTEAAVSLEVFTAETQRAQRLRVGVCVTRKVDRATIRMESRGEIIFEREVDLAPDRAFVEEVNLPREAKKSDLKISVRPREDQALIQYQLSEAKCADTLVAATEPPAPADVKSSDELYIIGLHLDQYRHTTRMPELYWREALRRDPLDSRCNNAIGLWHYRRGEFVAAEPFFRRAIERLTSRNANPYDGEAYYNLGLNLRALHRDDEAYDAFYKATWNRPWQGSAFFQIAQIDCMRGDWKKAINHLDRSLSVGIDNLKARNLRAIALRKIGVRATDLVATNASSWGPDDATNLLRQTLALDPLDYQAKFLLGEELNCDDQVRLDLALDFAAAGLIEESIAVLNAAHALKGEAPAEPSRNPSRASPGPSLSEIWPSPSTSGANPLTHYYIALFSAKVGRHDEVSRHLAAAAKASSDYCFPSRLEEIPILQFAIDNNKNDAKAPYYLGNLLYDRKRHREAIACWEESIKRDPKFPTVWRNLGIAYFNIFHQPEKAVHAYNQAIALSPNDARILYERDQLFKRLSHLPEKRLDELLKHPNLLALRDDLAIELCHLYNLTGQHKNALAILRSRQFQPWEGGEGLALGQHVMTHLALGQLALEDDEPAKALDHFEMALKSPENLGEAKHLLANQSNIHYFLGEAYHALGNEEMSKRHWRRAANTKGDFQEMSIRSYSEMTYYSALSLKRLAREGDAAKLLESLLSYAQQLEKTPATIEYFATSLPTMLLFDDDLQKRQTIVARLMQAQAYLGLNQSDRGIPLLKDVLSMDPSHLLASQLLESAQKKTRMSAVMK